ncbi:MAG: hypothetical protein ACO3EZ_19365, partial [Prochlorotrichaceae cyanobacterium]
ALAELRSIVQQGFGGSRRVLNSDQLDQDGATGYIYLDKTNEDPVLLLEITPAGDGILYFDRLMCEIDSYDPNCR